MSGHSAICCLESSDSVEADGRWKVAGLTETGEGAIGLIDGEDANVSGLRVNGVDEFSVGADGDVHIVTAGRVVAEDGPGMGVREPSLWMLKPEMLSLPEFET
jgi:hypothetical protein